MRAPRCRGLMISILAFGLVACDAQQADLEPAGPVILVGIDGASWNAIESKNLGGFRDRLIADLAQVTYTTGEPAFRIREPKRDEMERGADLTVVVQQVGVSAELEFRGQEIPRAIASFHEITGSLDVTPTLLYALSLPIAQDFDGRPQTDLFRREFRQLHPVQTIPSWGTRDPGEALSSQADAELLEELRALGYLD